MRIPVPAAWRCVLALPEAPEGLSGTAEERFFGQLARTAEAGVEPTVSRQLLTELLPGLQAGDLDEFGAALSAIQRSVGSIFAEAQGGVFHPAAAPLIAALQELGVGAVGQSSWGPVAYGILDGVQSAREVAGALAARCPQAEIRVVDFDRAGAVVREGAGA